MGGQFLSSLKTGLSRSKEEKEKVNKLSLAKDLLQIGLVKVKDWLKEKSLPGGAKFS